MIKQMLQKIQQCGGVTCQGGRIPGRLRLQQGQQSHPEWHLPEKKAKFSLQAILQGVFHRIVLVVGDFLLHHRVQCRCHQSQAATTARWQRAGAASQALALATGQVEKQRAQQWPVRAPSKCSPAICQYIKASEHLGTGPSCKRLFETGNFEQIKENDESSLNDAFISFWKFYLSYEEI